MDTEGIKNEEIEPKKSPTNSVISNDQVEVKPKVISGDGDIGKIGIRSSLETPKSSHELNLPSPTGSISLEKLKASADDKPKKVLNPIDFDSKQNEEHERISCAKIIGRIAIVLSLLCTIGCGANLIRSSVICWQGLESQKGY